MGEWSLAHAMGAPEATAASLSEHVNKHSPQISDRPVLRLSLPSQRFAAPAGISDAPLSTATSALANHGGFAQPSFAEWHPLSPFSLSWSREFQGIELLSDTGPI